jgi:hypothetical protein
LKDIHEEKKNLLQFGQEKKRRRRRRAREKKKKGYLSDHIFFIFEINGK